MHVWPLAQTFAKQPENIWHKLAWLVHKINQWKCVSWRFQNCRCGCLTAWQTDDQSSCCFSRIFKCEWAICVCNRRVRKTRERFIKTKDKYIMWNAEGKTRHMGRVFPALTRIKHLAKMKHLSHRWVILEVGLDQHCVAAIYLETNWRMIWSESKRATLFQ